MDISSGIPALVEEERQSANFHPTIWGDYFIIKPPTPQTELASLKLRKDKLKEEVRRMIKGSTDALQSLELIDRIQRLGVAYHFVNEINGKLNAIHSTGYDSNDLYEASLHFRLLRQHRQHLSSNVFERFLNEEGEFKASFENNVKALLSLYEAAHLCLPGEEILDKAKKFTRNLLVETNLSKMEPHFAMMVTSALDVPLIRRVDRPRTKLYLSIYENENVVCKEVLDFAKIDFVILQALYRDEVRSLSMWWKNSGLTKILPFARDRIVECFFWVLSLYKEPCYSRARVMMAKTIALLSITDDIYDTFGKLEELKLLTDVVKSWELGSVNNLPIYMQQYFLVVCHTFKNFEEELVDENYSFRVKYATEEFKKMAQAYLEEAKWAKELYIPKLEDHLSVSLVTAGHSFVTCASFMGMKDVISDDVFQWVCSMPAIMISSSFIGRVMNDIAGVVDLKFEHEKNVASTVLCYMMEHRCSKEEACKKLKEMMEENWKIINREFMFSDKIPTTLMQIIVKLTNFNELVYKNEDHYTNSKLAMKDFINAVLVEPVQIDL